MITQLFFISGLAFLSLAALPVLAWAIFVLVRTPRRKYGLAIMGTGTTVGFAAVCLLLGLNYYFAWFALPVFVWVAVFLSGFCLAGGACAVLGLIAPLFRYNNRLPARSRA